MKDERLEEKREVARKIFEILYKQLSPFEYKKLSKGNEVPFASEIILLCGSKDLSMQEVLDSLSIVEKVLPYSTFKFR